MLHGAEASGEGSREDVRQHEPESSVSPNPSRTLHPVESRFTPARGDFASLLSVEWAAALDIDGPDLLLAGSANFSPWRGSEFSDPSPKFEGLAREGAEDYTGARFLTSPAAAGLTSSERSPEAGAGEDLLPEISEG